MSTARYVHWQDGGMWLGYLEEFPDYQTQGESLAELEDNLRDLCTDLTSVTFNSPHTASAAPNSSLRSITAPPNR